ncbi:MAG: hypothetical protein KIT72_12495 [Polyangiaceae bacterium]|nr:hypothetical protein [Polyangiaceae bacterium]MCW5791233.1 hypothetical protein [Polyangiaceae bacterium]
MRRAGWVVALTAALVTSPACGGSRQLASPPSAAPARPEAAIPGDLDWVLRLDLRRVRRALGAARLIALGAEELTGDAPSVARALLHADTLWLALRPGERLEDTDYVVIAQGSFRDFTPAGEGEQWGPEVDLGADWRRQERRGLARLRRQDVARLYRSGDDVLVFVSAVELHSVARQLERLEGDRRVTPPALGVLSLAGRLERRPLAFQRRAPELGELLEGAREVTGHASLEAGELQVELALEYADEPSARAAETRAKEALTHALTVAPLRSWFAGSRLSRVGAHLVLRLTVPASAVQALLGADEASTEPGAVD